MNEQVPNKVRGKNMSRRACLCVLAASIALPVSALAEKAGLQTKFSMVTLENLEPGETYNTRELVNLPLTIRNTGDAKTTIKIDVLKPQTSKSMAENNYEAIPSTSWVRLAQDELDIGAGESAGTDVIVSIPDDDRYLNKRYQVDLYIKGTGRQFINVALLSNLRFTTAGRRLNKEELARRKKVEAYGNKIQFDLLPAKAFIEECPLGKEVDVEKEKKVSLEISNPNDIDFTYFLDVLTFGIMELPLLEGYSDLPDPSIVKLERREITVAANSIRKVKMVLKVPDQQNYRGKKFCFAVKATVSGTPVELNQVSRFYVGTQK